MLEAVREQCFSVPDVSLDPLADDRDDPSVTLDSSFLSDLVLTETICDLAKDLRLKLSLSLDDFDDFV